MNLIGGLQYAPSWTVENHWLERIGSSVVVRASSLRCPRSWALAMSEPWAPWTSRWPQPWVRLRERQEPVAKKMPRRPWPHDDSVPIPKRRPRPVVAHGIELGTESEVAEGIARNIDEMTATNIDAATAAMTDESDAEESATTSAADDEMTDESKTTTCAAVDEYAELSTSTCEPDV